MAKKQGGGGRADGLAGILGALGQAVTATVGPLARLGASVSSVVGVGLLPLTGTLAAVGGTLQGAGAAAGGLSAAFRAAADSFGGVLAGLNSALTLGASAVTGLVAPVSRFVEALNPNLVDLFGRAMQGLFATVGVAFEPLLQVLIPVVQQMAGTLLPAAQALAPVVAQLAGVFGSVLLPVVRIVATLLQALAPLLQVVATVFQILLSVLQPILTALEIVAVALRGFFEFLGKAMLGPLGKLLEGLASVMGTVIRAMLLFAATLAQALGFDKFVDELIESLTPRAGMTPGARDFQISGFEQIAKDITLAAARASMPGAEASSADPMRDMVGELRDIKAGKGTLGEIAAGVNAIVNFLGLGPVQTMSSVVVTHNPDGSTTVVGSSSNPGGPD